MAQFIKIQHFANTIIKTRATCANIGIAIGNGIYIYEIYHYNKIHTDDKQVNINCLEVLSHSIVGGIFGYSLPYGIILSPIIIPTIIGYNKFIKTTFKKSF